MNPRAKPATRPEYPSYLVRFAWRYLGLGILLAVHERIFRDDP
jgi:hypothetical protein